MKYYGSRRQMAQQLIFSYLLFIHIDQSLAKRLPDLYWNSSNSIFNENRAELQVDIMDTLVIHCPKLLITNTGNQLEQMIIYRVSYHSYENCQLDQSAKYVGECTSANNSTDIRIVFRRYTPLPNGLEYIPGRHYFFISTSTGTLNGLNNSNGGLCQTKNLRLKISMIPHNNRRTKNGDNRRINGFNRNMTTMESTTVRLVKTTTIPPYFDEFINKLNERHSTNSENIDKSTNRYNSIDRNTFVGIDQIYRKHSYRTSNDFEVDNQIDNNIDDRNEQKNDNDISSIVTTNEQNDLPPPYFKLYEIHEDFLPYHSSTDSLSSTRQSYQLIVDYRLLLSLLMFISILSLHSHMYIL